MLSLRDDACFHGRRPCRIHHQPASVETGITHQITQDRADMIVAHYADQHRHASQRPDVVGNICSSAQTHRFGFHFHDGHGSFRRHTPYRPPVVPVEHEVANDRNPFAGKAFEKSIKLLLRRNHQFLL